MKGPISFMNNIPLSTNHSVLMTDKFYLYRKSLGIGYNTPQNSDGKIISSVETMMQGKMQL
jgi:hypothetical protein